MPLKNLNIDIDRCNMCTHYQRDAYTEPSGDNSAHWCLKSERPIVGGRFIVKIPLWCELDDVEQRVPIGPRETDMGAIMEAAALADPDVPMFIRSTSSQGAERPHPAPSAQTEPQTRYADLASAVDAAEAETDTEWWNR